MRVLFQGEGTHVHLMDALLRATRNTRQAKKLWYEAHSELVLYKKEYGHWSDVRDFLLEHFPESNKGAQELIRELEQYADDYQQEEESSSSSSHGKRSREEEEPPLNGSDEEFVHPPPAIETTCQVMNTLTSTFVAIKDHDSALSQRLLLLLANQQRVLESYCNRTTEDQALPVFVKERIKERGYDDPTKDELFEVGKRAKTLYFQKYHTFPPKAMRYIDGSIKMINKYTDVTAPDTLDVAIEEILGINSESL